LKHYLCRLDRVVAIDSLHCLVIEDADLMYLGCQLGEFPVVLDGGFIYGDDLKTLVKEASSYEV
jgi:hypothetical protein